MLAVRRYEDRDKARVEKICIETAGQKASADKRYGETILYMYNRYYTSKSRDYCFVAADENDDAVGYIICAPDSREYGRGYIRNELKEVLKTTPYCALASLGEVLIYRRNRKKYPAHLHIDLAQGYRHMGLGTALISALCARLRSEGIKGVMLIVSASNESAISFYLKNGFNCLLKTKIFCVMGREIV